MMFIKKIVDKLVNYFSNAFDKKLRAFIGSIRFSIQFEFQLFVISLFSGYV